MWRFGRSPLGRTWVPRAASPFSLPFVCRWLGSGKHGDKTETGVFSSLHAPRPLGCEQPNPLSSFPQFPPFGNRWPCPSPNPRLLRHNQTTYIPSLLRSLSFSLCPSSITTTIIIIIIIILTSIKEPETMRMSCNGCRVLRKGCSDNCSIRPCLQWIKNPESQANATVFLAKFYGRAGLMNLINAGPEHLRPAIFRSLLYEACGRMVNPIYGSVGLLWSGSWQLCQAAVEAVLKGAPIVQISSEAAAPVPPLKGYDIRHVSKDSGAPVGELHKVAKPRSRFKRSAAAKPKPVPVPVPGWLQCHSEASHDSSDSIFSTDTMEASHVSQAEPNCSKSQAWIEDGDEVDLELTLGLFAPGPAPAPASTQLD